MDCDDPRARRARMTEYRRGRGSVGGVARPTLCAWLLRPRFVATRESNPGIGESEGPTVLLGRVLEGWRVAVVTPGIGGPATPIEKLTHFGEFRADALVVGAPGKPVWPHGEREQRLVHRGLQHESG